MITLIIDNYDSFTYNLFQYVSELNGQEAIVVKNDELTLEQLSALDFDNILISPGPGHPAIPRDFGVCTDVILKLNRPTLGVCLGHQGIAHLNGGSVTRAREPRHGRVSKVYHSATGLFEGIPSPFEVVRYHSLSADISGAADLVPTAWTADGVLMGLVHHTRPLWGVQFHPESICTEFGHQILRNFRDMSHSSLGERRVMSTVRVSEAEPPMPAHEPQWRVNYRAMGRLLDPEAVFHALYANARSAFWLDSSLVRPGLSRFSFMGDASGPRSEVLLYNSAERRLKRIRPGCEDELSESIFDYLSRCAISGLAGADGLRLPFRGGHVGYLGYELKQECGGDAPHSAGYPDAAMIFADRFLAFDHDAGETWLVELTRNGDQGPTDWLEAMAARLQTVEPVPRVAAAGSQKGPVQFRLRENRKTYIDNIHRALEYIRAGESYEVCLTTQIEANVAVEGLSLYSVLRHTNPAPFASYLRLAGLEVISASPERFVMVDRGGRVEAKPIKGTAKRGLTPAEDAQIAADLEADEKSRSENLMIVD
ncbi:MAG: chorismate-binding protein, partial [Acetobacteraceae bacterium]|nr:chorismate-binding protein [Acetobacteraceae bacterium]